MDAGQAGRMFLYGAFAASLWAAAASLIAARKRDRRWSEVGRRALYSATILIFLSTILLVIALFARDFSVAAVAGYTSRSTPGIYTLTALWAGMEGSLLFWTALTSVYAASAIALQRRRATDLLPTATAVLAGGLVFFTAMLAFGANPFAAVNPVPMDGSGLNPLLQSPFMAIHPVLLYLGLTGFAVPFAFAIAALAAGRLDSSWFVSTRRWTVGAWSFLSIGIIVGAAWAYHELGWGGYWAWDPVENASLLPWLTATAFLHSVLIQERRGMLKVWNAALVLATYALAIFGTFLTRSGLLSSVHTFSESPLGKSFLPFLALVLIGAFGLLGVRADRLRSERHLDSVLSREAMFLFNNLLFTAIAFTVLWGTLYPILVEAVRGVRVSVGPPYFNSVVVPLGLALVALSGIGPLVAWRRASAQSLKRHFAAPLAAGAVAILALAVAGIHSPGALLALGLCVFVTTAIAGEFVRGISAHRSVEKTGWAVALYRLVRRNRRRYGGYVIHLGVVLIVLGLSGTAFKKSWSGTLSVGDAFDIGSYTVRYAEPRAYSTDEKMVMMAVMEISRGGRSIGTLAPQRNFHFAQQQPQSEVGLRTTLAEDLYLVLTQMDPDRSVTIRAWVNPLVAWIWIGGAVMALGMLIILTGKPAPEPPRVAVPPRAERETVAA
jgi:cytochrome c-type biogenesis protein CcmF